MINTTATCWVPTADMRGSKASVRAPAFIHSLYFFFLGRGWGSIVSLSFSLIACLPRVLFGKAPRTGEGKGKFGVPELSFVFVKDHWTFIAPRS